MIIPKSIQIGRVQYRVRPTPCPGSSLAGRIYYQNAVIHLNTYQGTFKPRIKSPRSLSRTFWHEVTHGILHDMGEYGLRDCESFVEAFAARLNRAVWSAKL